MTPELTDASTWNWAEVRRSLGASPERDTADGRNAIEVLSVNRLSEPWEVSISFLDRREGSQHQEQLDLLRCVSAYDATTVEQLAAMVYSDLEESVLATPSS